MRHLVSLTFIFAISFFFACKSDKTNKINGSETDTLSAEQTAALAKLCVASPAPKLNIAPQTFLVPDNKAQNFSLKSGSSINVPENAFVDKQGKPIAVPVKLLFREFHTPAEIILSGIPMKVRMNDGKEEQMQTAGMFEINGTTEQGEAVFIAPNKNVTVNVHSEVKGQYDSWYFDQNLGNWTDIGENVEKSAENSDKSKGKSNHEGSNEVATAEEIDNQNAVETTATTTATKPSKKEPVKPVAFDKSKPSLNFNVKYDNFPELKAMKGLVFQYSGSGKGVDPAKNKWIMKEPWEKIDLAKGTVANEYIMTLESDSTEIKIPVCPSQSGEDYSAALKAYEEQIAAYRAYKAQYGKYQEVQSKFIRSLNVSNFGIYNCDVLYKIKEPIPLMADFDFGIPLPADVLSSIHVYLVCENSKVIFYYPSYYWKNAVIPLKDDCYLVSILPDGSIAQITTDEMRKQKQDIINAKGKPYLFKMTRKGSSKPIESAPEFDKLILAAI
jgi:hypothetical protein